MLLEYLAPSAASLGPLRLCCWARSGMLAGYWAALRSRFLQVLCTVSDQRQALSEARRVLKPGGRLVFLEHVAAPQGQWLHTMQHALNPAVGFFGHGCSCCRDTLAAIRSAGFAVVDADEFTLPIWGPLAVIGPHISGVARK